MTDRARAYESYEGFLRESIRTYWESKRAKKVTFLALLFACQQAWGAALDEARDPGVVKKVLTGVGGAAAVAVVLRLVLGGPIGILLTAASIASLVALYIRNHAAIMQRVAHYREVIEEYRPRYGAIVGDHASKRIDDSQRDLMIDGLMKRFLDELDEFEPEAGAESDDDDDDDDGLTSFERHVESRKASASDPEPAEHDDERGPDHERDD